MENTPDAFRSRVAEAKVQRGEATDVVVCANGFVKVASADGSVHYVQGMQNALRVRIPDANDSRASCTCATGHALVWCAHRRAAYEALVPK